MKNIVLVGFMGTGKTAVAKELSKRLGLRYVSTDELIEKKAGIPIPDIFAGKGEGYFRDVEKKVVKESSSHEGVVIDSGGGVMIDPENVKNLKKKGIIICLWSEPELILERTKKYCHRPLLNVENPLEKIKELITSRRPFYEKADCHVDTSCMSVKTAADEIERILKEKDSVNERKKDNQTK